MPPPERAAGPVALDEAAVRAALDAVVDPCSVAAGAPLSLAEMGLLRGVEVDGGAVRVSIAVTGPGCMFLGLLLSSARDAVAAVPGVRSVDVALDTAAVWDPSWLAPSAASALDSRRRTTLALTAVRPRQWEERTA